MRTLIEASRKCCMNCLYWHGCVVIAKVVIAKSEASFSCNDCYCKLFEPNDKPTLNEKLQANDWIIPDIIHSTTTPDK